MIQFKTKEYFYIDIERLICLLVLTVMGFLLYGNRVFIVAAVALGTALACDLIMHIARSNCYTSKDISSVVIAMTLTLMFPANIDYLVVIVSTLVAVLIGKYAFGGLHHYPFSPVAIGYAVAVVNWPDKVFSYPSPIVRTSMTLESAAIIQSPESALNSGGLPNITHIDILNGNFAGGMGTTFILVLAACALLLVLRRDISFSVLVAFLATCSAFVLLFPRVTGEPLATVLLYELSAGSLLYTAIFIVTDNVVVPQRLLAKIMYAVVLGVVVMYFRYYGAYEQDSCFAIIVVSSLCSLFDRLAKRVYDLFTDDRGVQVG